MVVLTLPMTVVISKFNRAYEHKSRQTQRYMIVDTPPGDSDPKLGETLPDTHPNSAHYRNWDIESLGFPSVLAALRSAQRKPPPSPREWLGEKLSPPPILKRRSRRSLPINRYNSESNIIYLPTNKGKRGSINWRKIAFRLEFTCECSVYRYASLMT